MHVAAQAGHTGFVEVSQPRSHHQSHVKQLLCELGADVDLSDTQGNTPLH